jgi:hypothetical protein
MNFTFKTFNEFINESVSDICYHITNTENTLKILKQNIFKTTPKFTHRADVNSSNRSYYFSTTRSKDINSGYALAKFDEQGYIVRLTLDGTKLNQRFKSKSVDYWNEKSKHKITRSKGVSYEAEDRIITNSNHIKDALKYIKKIEFILSNALYHYLGSDVYDIVDIYHICEEKNIECKIYTSRKEYNKGIGNFIPINTFLYMIRDIEDDRNEFRKNDNQIKEDIFITWMKLLVSLNINKSKKEIENIVNQTSISTDIIIKNFNNLYRAITNLFDKENYYYITRYLDTMNDYDIGIVPEYDRYINNLTKEINRFGGNKEKFVKNLLV